MQRDSLEKFIMANREALDQGVPSLKVWAGIDHQLSRATAVRVSMWRIARIAAAVAALLFIGAVAGNYLARTGGEDPSVALREIAPEFLEMQQYYEQQIDARVQQLTHYRQSDNVLADFKSLDAAVDELKQELLRAPKGQEEEIIENLVRSYQTKIQVLERVLERIQSTNPQPAKSADDEISI